MLRKFGSGAGDVRKQQLSEVGKPPLHKVSEVSKPRLNRSGLRAKHLLSDASQFSFAVGYCFKKETGMPALGNGACKLAKLSFPDRHALPG